MDTAIKPRAVGLGSLSIRSYSLEQSSHAHPFHQIVIPLAGAMDISLGGQTFGVRSAMRIMPGVWTSVLFNFDGTTASLYVHGRVEDELAIALEGRGSGTAPGTGDICHFTVESQQLFPTGGRSAVAPR